ncbi:MAG: cation transporter [Gemmatimonadetes bacterium]|nr:MAG: cation transporter [Gemmatimonadota bacterium]
MEKITSRATRITILTNALLFLVKLLAGIFAGSLAIISDAMNSFMDILSSVAIWAAVRVSYKEADWNHPFGHSRAQPVAGLVVAVLAGVLGIEILQTAIMNLITATHDHQFKLVPVLVLVISILSKLFLARYLQHVGTQADSPAIRASAVDSRNDVLISSVALIGYLLATMGWLAVDDVAAMIISGFIIYAGFDIGKENLDYLMGSIPAEEHVERMKKLMLNVDGVLDFNEIRAHYVGHFVHVEVHIDVASELTVREAHDIGTAVQAQLETLDIVDRAFVHIDPICVTREGKD